MTTRHILLITLSFMFSLPAFACGTAQNWMDAYDGVKTSNKWRNSTSQLGSLVMLRSCGSYYLNKKDQVRLARILTEALSQKSRLSMLRPTNRDISKDVRRYTSVAGVELLVESIYRRFQCLQRAQNSASLKIKNHDQTLHEYFGTNSCPGGKQIVVFVNAPSGARMRMKPGGRIINSLRDGTKLSVIRIEGDWYRVINPVKNGTQDSLIGYLHKSVIKDVNNKL